MFRSGDEGFRAASHLLDAAKIMPPSDQTPPGTPPTRHPAFNLAFGFSGPSFEWRSHPENAWRAQRLGKAMQQLHRMANANVSEGKLGVSSALLVALLPASFQIIHGTSCPPRSSMSVVVLVPSSCPSSNTNATIALNLLYSTSQM